MSQDQNQLETFGRWLRRERKQRDLTGQELAHQVGCSSETLRKIESDVHRPSKQMVARIAECLDVPDQELQDLMRLARGGQPAIAAPSAPEPAPLPSPALLQSVSQAPLTALIGREQELQFLCRRVMEHGLRLLTLTGPGGVGKTRLALQLAGDLRDAFNQRVFFIPLAPLDDPDLVLKTIAQHLEIKETSEAGMAQALGTLPTMLVLDNLEHLLPAAARLGTLLAAAPTLRMVVTSRTPLHLYGEYEFQVPPLALPDLSQRPVLDELAQVPTVALFVDRAAAVCTNFVLTEENASSVAEICQRLDGLPLAIELAAARSKLLAPATLLNHLSSRLALLTDGPRDVAERQQTLRNTIDWSYTLLSPATQALFARLGVFAGGATMEAVQAVCGEPNSSNLDLLTELTALLDNSLLQRTQGPEMRFTMLETIREYALEQLSADEAETMKSRHARYFARVLKAPPPHFYTPEQREWINRCKIEYYNLQAALIWAYERQDAELVLGLVGGLWGPWRHHGHVTEGQQWLERALRMSPTPSGRLRLDALLSAGMLAFIQDDYAAAQAFFSEGLVLERQLGTNAQIAYALYSLGLVVYWQGDYAQAVELFKEALEVYGLGTERFGKERLLLYLGMAHLNLGQAAEANDLHEQSLALYRERADPSSLGYALTFTGRAALYQGRYQQARRSLEESLILLTQVNHRPGISRALVYLGRVGLTEGAIQEAAQNIKTSLRMFRQINDREGIATALEALAGVAHAEGDLAQVARLSGAAAALRDQLGAPLPAADRGYMDTLMTMATTALGSSTFDHLWTAGRSMSIDWDPEAVPMNVDG